MTIAKDFAAKLAIAFVAVAMVLSAFAPASQAQTTEELQAMINDLLAQVASLSGSTSGGSSSAAGVCPFTWTRDLSTGSTGADVKALQQFLNANADTRVAATGAGSAGMETETFGPMTAAAVSKFQVMHRADVLTPAGLVNPTGYFGPGTRAKANSLCTTASTDDSDDSEDTDEDEDSEDAELSGEASLDSFEIDSASDDEIEEGATDAEIAVANFEFSDGDASISRLDVALIGSGDEQDPWDTFDTISLWVDGEMVAEFDASDEDEYLDEDGGEIRFSGLDIVAMEDEEVEITIGATVQDSVDGTNNGEAWTVEVNALRFFDADGVATTEDSGEDFGSTVSFTVDEAGAEDELIAKTSSSDPDAATLQVEDDSKSDWYTVFIFDLDTDDSINDITINELDVNVVTNGTVAGNAGFLDLVDDAELVIDGTTIDSYDVSGAGSTTEGTTVLTFDVDGDVEIAAGDRVAAELKLKFKSLPSAEEGATVQGTVSSLTTSVVDAEGADDLANGQLSGAATGEVHTLRTSGIEVTLESDEAEVEVVDGNDNDYATFAIELEVTAFEQDVFIPINSASTSWAIQDENGDDILTADNASTTVVITSSAEEGGASDAFFEISEGSTETVTVTVTFTPGPTSPVSARLQLTSLVFDETGTATKTDDGTWNALPESTYRTDTVTIQN